MGGDTKIPWKEILVNIIWDCSMCHEEAKPGKREEMDKVTVSNRIIWIGIFE
jgi:hypothetical protein